MAGKQDFNHNLAGGNSRNHYGNVYNFGGSATTSPAYMQNSSTPKSPPASSAQHARPSSLNGFRIAIICALKREYDAVDVLMEEVWEQEEAFRPRRPDDNTYTFGRLGGKPVALVNLPSMGKISAAVVASNLRISLPNIEIAFLVGLCAGAPDDGKGNTISMGDVIIGTQVILQEDYGRLRDEGFERKTDVEDTLGRLPVRVRGWLVQRSGRRHRKELRQYTEAVLADAFKDSETANDFSFPGREADESYPSSRKLQIFFGRIGSSNPTLRSQARRDEMIKQDGILGFEMESAGIWDQLPTVVVKAVCDYGDNQKNKEWQDFAALTAAACTKALVRDWILHVQDRISGGQLTTASLSQLKLAFDSSNEHQKGPDDASSANNPELPSAKPHESPGQDADEANAMDNAFWSIVSLAWIYAFPDMLLGQPSNTSAVNTAHKTEQLSGPSTIRDQIEDAISGVKKVVSIFGDAVESLDDAGDTCSRIQVELFIVAEWLDEKIEGIEDCEESTFSRDVQSVFSAIEKVLQDRPHESRHKYPRLRVLALCAHQSRPYKIEKARVLSRLRSLIQAGGTALEDLERQLSSFTKSRGISASSAEAAFQPMRAKPAGYSSVVKKAIHRILNQSMRCKCPRDSSQGSSHLLQILLEPITAATPSTTPRFELLISSEPIGYLHQVTQRKEKISGHWRDVFITYSSAKVGPAKNVRWVDGFDIPRSQPEFTEEIKHNDHALCGIIPRGSVHQRWGVQVTGDQLFRTGRPLERHKMVEAYHGVPLRSVIGHLSDRIRVCLAYILAQSLWQFYDCDLAGVEWTCDSVELMWHKEGSKADDLRLFSFMPYLAYRSTTQSSYVHECLRRETECDSIHAYPRVLALGILLLELGMGKKFELPESFIADPVSGPTREDGWSHAQKQARPPWPSLDIDKYWESVQNCFEVHLFNHASADTEVTADEKELGLSKRRDILYEKIVLPLEQLADGTRWVDRLGSKEFVSFPSCSSEASHVESSPSILVAA